MKNLKNGNKKKFDGSKAAITFYVLAVVFVAYGAYMIYTVYEYLVAYYASYNVGMWDDVKNTLQYFVSNTSQYFVYAILCYGIGMIINTLHGMKKALIVTKAEVEEVEAEEVVKEDTTIEYNSEEKTA